MAEAKPHPNTVYQRAGRIMWDLPPQNSCEQAWDSEKAAYIGCLVRDPLLGDKEILHVNLSGAEGKTRNK